MAISIRQAATDDIHALRELCIDTFVAAYASFNTKENMEFYLKGNFSGEKILEELEDEGCLAGRAAAGTTPRGCDGRGASAVLSSGSPSVSAVRNSTAGPLGPNEITSPLASGVSPFTRWPLTYVP